MSPRLRVVLSLAALLAPLVVRAAEPRFRVEYATYLGGAEWDQAREVIVCPDGSVLVGGKTDAFIVKLVPSQSKEASDGERTLPDRPGSHRGGALSAPRSARRPD